MNPLAALAVTCVILALVTLLGLIWRARSGHVRALSGVRADATSILAEDAPLGSAATIVQFSTEFCAPCRAAGRVLAGVVANRPLVRHIEIDLADRPRLASEFDIVQTPTTLLLDAAGTIRARIAGVPRADEVADHVDRLVSESNAVYR